MKRTRIPGLGTVQVLEASGLTYRQVDHAIRKGWYVPPHRAKGTGDHHRFTEHDVEVACQAAAYLADGWTAQAAWRLASTGGRVHA